MGATPFPELLGMAIGAFGEKPEKQELAPVDFTQAQGEAIGANLSNLPGLEQLATATNKYGLTSGMSTLRSIFPNFDRILNLSTDNVESMLRGEVPQDVAGLLERRSAGQAVSGGYAGTGMHRNLAARDLGRTSLDLKEMGTKMAPGVLGGFTNLINPSRFDISSMYVTPSQRINYLQGYNRDKLGLDVYNANIDAAPDPNMAALYAAIRSNEDFWVNTGMSLMGKPGGAPSGGPSPSMNQSTGMGIG